MGGEGERLGAVEFELSNEAVGICVVLIILFWLCEYLLLSVQTVNLRVTGV